MTDDARHARDQGPTVSLVVVTITHNALRYFLRMLYSLPQMRGVAYDLVVNRNWWSQINRPIMAACTLLGRIQRLSPPDMNALFAPGNNIGAAATSCASSDVRLLNSDVEARDPDSMRRLLALHRRGGTSLGSVDPEPIPRADGCCLLVDRDLMLEHGLDDEFEWYWSMTKLQALLAEGQQVRAVRQHDHLLYHFGGKSGTPATTDSAKGMDLERDKVRTWFGGRSVEPIEPA